MKCKIKQFTSSFCLEYCNIVYMSSRVIIVERVKTQCKFACSLWVLNFVVPEEGT
jgi:hypothetical protein